MDELEESRVERRDEDAAPALALLEARDAMRALVRRRATLSAIAAATPVPGLDLAVDAAAFADMLSNINRAFALTPEQIGRLHTEERVAVLSALSQVGALFAGRYVTSAMALTAFKQLGARWAAGRAAKWVPLAGQAAAAGLSWWAVVKLGDAHIDECLRVRERARALLAAPGSSSLS